jgi:S-adenosylmethionine:tRNA ribosyltransferase-isomerase
MKDEKLKIKHINLEDYDYILPEDKIAQYPVDVRDMSRLLIHRNGANSMDHFKNISEYLHPDSILIFNNTRVIKARILFPKISGGVIEILCLDPLTPFEYELSLKSKYAVEWKCMVGNLKKWKSDIISTSFQWKGKDYLFTARKIRSEGDAWRILFDWNCPELNFGEVIEIAGHIPLPPYIKREDKPADIQTYQTIYSLVEGSVAAPTAGLHFTHNVLEKLTAKKIKSVNITLHIGAGTFKPVRSDNISEHEMHCEHFSVNDNTIEHLIQNTGNIVAVGTTSVRTLESLYWMGVKLIKGIAVSPADFHLGQWEAYSTGQTVSAKESMEAILNFLRKRNLPALQASTKMMIVPGYNFKMTNGIITNFHQPRSTLLLLISAWTGSEWKKIYNYAIENNFRFLSYGDCSLLI